MKTHLDDVSIIPSQYRYPLATNYIEELFLNGRATTIPEALDKFEEHQHRWKVEQGLMINLQMQAKQIELLDDICRWI